MDYVVLNMNELILSGHSFETLEGVALILAEVAKEAACRPSHDETFRVTVSGYTVTVRLCLAYEPGMMASSFPMGEVRTFADHVREVNFKVDEVTKDQVHKALAGL